MSISPALMASVSPISVKSTSTHPVNWFGVPGGLAVADQDQLGISHADERYPLIGCAVPVATRSSIKWANACQVLQRLTARHPPLPLFLDRRAKTQLQQRIEVGVDGLEHLAEDPVDLVGRDRVQRHPADEVDVADVVEGVGDAVEPAVALQQEAVDALVVLVGLAADERLDAHRVFADGQDRVGLQPALARQFDDDARQPAARAFVAACRRGRSPCRLSSMTCLDALTHGHPRRIVKRLTAAPRRHVPALMAARGSR